METRQPWEFPSGAALPDYQTPSALNVIVGAGGVRRNGWLSLQYDDLNIVEGEQWSRLFAPSSIDAIVTEHTLEHLNVREAETTVKNFYRYLKPGGYVRCAVPDGFHPSSEYQEWVSPGSRGERLLQLFRGAERGHETLWNYRSLSALFENAGFVVSLREWFDERGDFYRTEWSKDQGYIRRCNGCPWSAWLSVIVGAPFTSLLMDAFKAA